MSVILAGKLTRMHTHAHKKTVYRQFSSKHNFNRKIVKRAKCYCFFRGYLYLKGKAVAHIVALGNLPIYGQLAHIGTVNCKSRPTIAQPYVKNLVEYLFFDGKWASAQLPGDIHRLCTTTCRKSVA